MPGIDIFENNTAGYEHWFEENQSVYMSELNAVRTLLPAQGEGVEIGVGTARFAAPLGVVYGVEPSVRMGRIAQQRGVQVVQGLGENLPLASAQFDFVLMVTTICFLDDVEKAFEEVHRIVRVGGSFVVGFIDKDSLIAKTYQRHKKASAFYSVVSLFSAGEVFQLLERTGFRDITTVQTLFHQLSETTGVEPVKPDYGDGSFLVVRGVK